ncbi:MAG: dehydrogenase [Candidatus Tectimicrobiota bacterium]|nr:MAG: dehydrogenase [Candidatus Tectomicrobia bacterium]
MPTFQAAALQEIATRIFEGAGSSPEEARIVSEHLVTANLMGHDSHGVIRIPQYLASVKNGTCVPNAPLEVVQETPATAVLNANWGYGQVAARRAMELAVAKAATQAVSAVGIHHCNHIGRLGAYPPLATAREMIAMVMVNGHGKGHLVAPYGGAEGRLVTNPIAVGIPTAQGEPLLLDVATSVVAEGKVRVKRNRGEPVPEGWLVDANGLPTTDPMALYSSPRGAILPLGGLIAGHKGFGLALVVEVLSGALSRAGCAHPEATRNGNGVFMLVLNIAAFTPVATFKQEVAQLAAYVKSARLMQGFSEILLPGEPEARTRERRAAEGIPVDDETWRQIVAAAKEFGVQVA